MMRVPFGIGIIVCALAIVGCGGADDIVGDDMVGDDGGGPIDGIWSDAEWTKISSFGPLASPPANPTNRYADSEAHARFGQKLWFEKRWAGPLLVGDDGSNGALGALGEVDKVACASCHMPDRWYSDFRSNPNTVSIGAGTTGRNTPSMVNAVYYTWGNWAASHDQFWKQGANGPESKDNFNGTRLDFIHVIFDHYRADYDAIYSVALDPAIGTDPSRYPPSGKPKAMATDPDGPWELMAPADRVVVNTIMANCGKALEAYERKLISRNSPLDRYIGGEYTALTQAQKNGLKLFISKAACDACHSGPTFTDQQFHNTGVVQMQDPMDMGQFSDIARLNNTFNGAGLYSDDPAAGAAKLASIGTQSEEMRGKFRTKSLRHLTETAPYFHKGSMATLEDVVRFYNDGGGEEMFPGTKDPRLVPLNLSEQEIADLVAFLEALTGDPVPAEWREDTHNP